MGVLNRILIHADAIRHWRAATSASNNGESRRQQYRTKLSKLGRDRYPQPHHNGAGHCGDAAINPSGAGTDDETRRFALLKEGTTSHGDRSEEEPMFNLGDSGSCATSLTDYLPGDVTKRLPSVAGLVMSGLFAGFAAISAQGASTLKEHPIMTTQTIAVEHVRIESAKSFADVRAALERTVPRLDPSLAKALDEGDVERVAREKKEGPELSIFQFRDHGALLKIAGKARNALQYDIGNPITASLMTRHRLAAALYPPIRVVLYENDAGHGVFEYDQPSTTFGQFGDERVTAVARGLDAALERALTRAAE
jgi:hypothetical protein